MVYMYIFFIYIYTYLIHYKYCRYSGCKFILPNVPWSQIHVFPHEPHSHRCEPPWAVRPILSPRSVDVSLKQSFYDAIPNQPWSLGIKGKLFGEKLRHVCILGWCLIWFKGWFEACFQQPKRSLSRDFDTADSQPQRLRPTHSHLAKLAVPFRADSEKRQQSWPILAEGRSDSDAHLP